LSHALAILRRDKSACPPPRWLQLSRHSFMNHVRFPPPVWHRALLLCASGALLLSGGLDACAAKSGNSREDLRKLLRLPPMQFTAEITFTTDGCLTWEGGHPNPDELAAARLSLRSDSSDGEFWLRLGRRLQRFDDRTGAATAYSNAVARLRAKTGQRPQDGRLLAQLGEALYLTDKDQEAESVLRRSVRLAPEDAETCLALASYLNSEGFCALLPVEKRADHAGGFRGFGELLAQHRPTAAQIEKAEKLQAEAMEFFNRAARLATNNPAILERRAGCHLTATFIRLLKQQLAAPQPDPSVFLTAIYSPECVPDLRRAAELEPGNALRLAQVALYEILSESIQRNGGRLQGLRLEDIQEASTAEASRSIRWKLNRLEELAESPVQATAAEASELLGSLRVFGLKDPRQAETSFRRAIALDPKRELAWDGLMAVLVVQERLSDLREQAEARLRARPTARNYVIVAKAYDRLRQPDKVAEYARGAVKLDPEWFLTQAALAISLLKQSDTPEARKEADQHLERAFELIKQADGRQRLGFQFTVGAYLALAGDLESARKMFRQVLEADPDHEEARAALAIVQAW
jgi:tetratricopeptide (TPR) repeat protein